MEGGIDPGAERQSKLILIHFENARSDPGLDHSAPPRTVSGTVLLSGITSPVILNFEVRSAYHLVYLEYAYHETSGILGLE